ncbi:MAG: hypothetical protein A2679_00055 [Candidatus Sungbacteria bacterium RIFCSPHIGHO2_01_FULL_54_26]|uniref:THIF-type NAD/FAD binding fold domain-containing protein n=1 Tax=Candidatus Sungbacteria bacterium RIFCSPHIGHO2_02_FULL_53_17 TaxID=1802275 RepID=A0A1G2KW23_9BACT|nr:MAG: hypothetical protein A2679_00055 [Candidatus Sungbacteria bacterium RIFCSPHIGHO2_01_FULL_54_26]OHA03600.1 MAG: hypothetical protein A3C92_01265 [Candidatus Sungbacteria bacterium RIFCSPHIGHO2_02_FULL_53_17]
MDLERALYEKSQVMASSLPQIFNAEKQGDRQRLSRLIRGHAIRHVSDDYEEQMREYFGILNPGIVYAHGFEEKFQAYFTNLRKKKSLWQSGRWVYFPWLSALSHILEDKEFQMVRTARNRNLITADEQKKFYNSVIGIAGLSVGNSVALAIVLSGGGRHMRLADYDRLALSNTNRIRAGVESLGVSKAEMTARQIYALNPYARIDLFPEGLTDQNMKKFFEGPPKANVIIEEIDNLAIKHRVREYAKRLGIPVIMGTDDGDNAVVDIERYDLYPKTPIFHGRLGKVSYEELNALPKMKAGFTVARHVGPENVPLRMQESLAEIGKTIVTWPQLGGSALLNACALAYCSRKILTGQPLVSNRAIISLDEKLEPSYDSKPRRKKRVAVARRFAKKIDEVLHV